MNAAKHLAFERWPSADRSAWAAAFEPGDIFDDSGPGAHLAPGSRKSIACGYSRWLAYLTARHPALLKQPPAERIDQAILRDYVACLQIDLSAMTVAAYLHHLYLAFGLIAQGRDWAWLREIKLAFEQRARPQDRFGLLSPPWQLLDLGIHLMESAEIGTKDPQHRGKIQYRNGLVLALLAHWPIRRRSLAALTVNRHLERRGEALNLLLYPEDTKAARAESFRIPDPIQPYFERYLIDLRPRFPEAKAHCGFWASLRGCPLGGQQLYSIVRRLTDSHFGRPMGLHDVRRAAATFLAVEAPEKVGLVPGVLQHASPEVGERHYNLARSTAASRRFAGHVTTIRKRLGPARRKRGG
jgi:hypothetical protein